MLYGRLGVEGIFLEMNPGGLAKLTVALGCCELGRALTGMNYYVCIRFNHQTNLCRHRVTL